MDHPLQTWLTAPHTHRSVERLAAALLKKGRRTSVRYLESIAAGYYPPGRKLSLLLAEITDLPLEDIAGYPYRAPRAA